MAAKFTQEAIKRIEELGGHAIAVYHDRNGIRQIKRPKSTGVHPSLPQYQPKLMPPMTYKSRLYYSQWESRGYLHPKIREVIRAIDPSFELHYLMVTPQAAVIKPIFDYRNIPAEVASESVSQ